MPRCLPPLTHAGQAVPGGQQDGPPDPGAAPDAGRGVRAPARHHRARQHDRVVLPVGAIHLRCAVPLHCTRTAVPARSGSHRLPACNAARRGSTAATPAKRATAKALLSRCARRPSTPAPSAVPRPHTLPCTTCCRGGCGAGVRGGQGRRRGDAVRPEASRRRARAAPVGAPPLRCRIAACAATRALHRYTGPPSACRHAGTRMMATPTPRWPSTRRRRRRSRRSARSAATWPLAPPTTAGPSGSTSLRSCTRVRRPQRLLF